MGQRPENFDAAGEDPEATLVTPRFDETDARRAHPVVPLEEARPGAAYAGAPRRARGPRRSWTPALLAVALLAVAAAAGAVATKVALGPRAGQAPEQTQEQTQGQAQPAPALAAEAPPPLQPPAHQIAESPREEAPAAGTETREARTRRARASAAPVAAESARDEVGDDDEDDRGARGWSAEKRRGREDDVEKELRKATKRARGKAPRLVDVLTSPEQ